MKIELVGLPGSGKTTLADALARALRQRGVACVTRDEAQARVSAYHAARPRAVRWSAYLVHLAMERAAAWASIELAARARPQIAKAYWRAYCLTRHTHNDAVIRGLVPPGTAFVLDQDLLQEIWSVLYLRACPDEGLLAGLLVVLRPRLPDVVVHVAIDGATALERIEARRRELGPVCDVDELPWVTARMLDRAGREAARIAQRAAEIGGSRLVEVDGREPTTSSVAAVLRAIDEPLFAHGQTMR